MSFIHKFLDITDTLPRRVVRLLKLLQVAEELSSNLKMNLDKKREQYLQNIKDKTSKKNLTLKCLKNLNKELLSLSDYKLELIKEIKYLIENSFLKNIPPIIKEGQKEIQEQVKSNSKSKINIPFSFNTNINSKIILDDDKKIIDNKSIDTELTTTTGISSNKFLNKKKSRPKSYKKSREDMPSEHPNRPADENKSKVYCKCKRESYGKMIQCDNPNCAEWYHYECIGIKEGHEPEEWYCCEKCKEIGKKVKTKIKKLHDILFIY